jgi:hypothetical protein
MKTRISALAILMIAAATNADAQSTAYASTTATLVTPISIAKVTDMDFGIVAASATAGTVVLDYADGRTITGGATLHGGSPTTAVFSVTGEGTNGFTISIPGSPITLTSGGNTMTVGNFVCDGGTSTSLTAGSATLKVKATLNVPANAPSGTYVNNLGNSSALFVTVNYN